MSGTVTCAGATASWMDEQLRRRSQARECLCDATLLRGSACSPAGVAEVRWERSPRWWTAAPYRRRRDHQWRRPPTGLSASFGSMRCRPTSRPCSYTRSITWPFSSSSLITAARKSSPAARSAASDTGCSRARRSCSRARRCWLSTSVTEPNYQILRPRRSGVPSAARARATATIPRRASWPGWRARQVVNTRAHGQEASKRRRRRPSCRRSRPGGVRTDPPQERDACRDRRMRLSAGGKRRRGRAALKAERAAVSPARSGSITCRTSNRAPGI